MLLHSQPTTMMIIWHTATTQLIPRLHYIQLPHPTMATSSPENYINGTKVQVPIHSTISKAKISQFKCGLIRLCHWVHVLTHYGVHNTTKSMWQPIHSTSTLLQQQQQQQPTDNNMPLPPNIISTWIQCYGHHQRPHFPFFHFSIFQRHR